MSKFETALKFTLAREGGFVNHPKDPGGATNLGITQATYNAHRKANGLGAKSVAEITHEEARRIYYEGYWIPAGCEELPSPLDVAHFDAAVNHGVGNAKILLSRSKGSWVEYIAARLHFWTDVRHSRTGEPLFGTFGRGWTRRGADLLAYCNSVDPK